MRLLKPIAVLPPHHENVGILTYIVNFFQVLNFGQLRCGIEISNCITFQERVCPKMLPRCPRKRTDSNGVFWGTWVTQLVDSWFHGFMTLGFISGHDPTTHVRLHPQGGICLGSPSPSPSAPSHTPTHVRSLFL